MLSVSLFVNSTLNLWWPENTTGTHTQEKNTAIVEKWRKSDTETSAIWIKNVYFSPQLGVQIIKINWEDHDALERAIRRRKDDVMMTKIHIYIFKMHFYILS